MKQSCSFEKLRKAEYERVNRSIYREVDAALPPTDESVGFCAAVSMRNIFQLPENFGGFPVSKRGNGNINNI